MAGGMSDASAHPTAELADLARLLPPEGRCNATAMRKAMRRVTQVYDAALAPCGLRSTQRAILVAIGRAKAPTIGQLAAALVIDRSALTHNLKPLQREGLVDVLADPADRRSRLVTLTEAARQKLVESHPLWEAAQRQFEAAFGEDRASDLRVALNHIASPEFEQIALGGQ